jgi:hypothetical protein
MTASTVATWLIAIPGFLLVGIPLVMGTVLVCKLILFAYYVGKSILSNVDYRFRPKLVYVPLSDDEVKFRYHNLDNKEHGYNPLRQDFADRELFRQKPVIFQIKTDAKKLFPKVDFDFIQEGDIYQAARTFFLRMLVERATMIDKGYWNTEKEKQWVNLRAVQNRCLSWIVIIWTGTINNWVNKAMWPQSL